MPECQSCQLRLRFALEMNKTNEVCTLKWNPLYSPLTPDFTFTKTTWCKKRTRMHSSRMRIPACTLPEGCLPGGVCPGGVCLGGVCPGGVSWGGVCTRGSAQGGCLPDTTPSPMNDWQTPVKILSCRNFVAEGKNANSSVWVYKVGNNSNIAKPRTWGYVFFALR